MKETQTIGLICSMCGAAKISVDVKAVGADDWYGYSCGCGLHPAPRPEETVAPLRVGRGGTISGALPCGHGAKWIEVFTEGDDRDPYCSKCWNI